MEKPTALLADILSAADAVLADDTLNNQQQTFMQHIRNTAARLQQIADDIPPTEYALRRILPALGATFEQPQATLYGYTRMLLEQPDSFGGAFLTDFQREQATIIYDRGLALAKLSRRLRTEMFEERKQQREATAINFDLNMLIWQQVPVYRYWMRDTAVRLTVAFPPGLPPVRGNPYHIGEIVQHIVVTTARELLEGGALRLSAHVSEDHTTLNLAIFCAGLHLAADDLETLFNSNGRHVYRERLAEQGGTLQLTRQPDVGATLLMCLPLAPRVTA